MKTPVLSIDAKLVTLWFVVILMIFSSSQCDAQSARKTKSTHGYYGLQGSFGRRTFLLQSNIPEINNVIHLDGGQLGVVLGNDIIRFDIGLVGYYSSTGNITGSIDYYTNHAIAKFFPLTAFKDGNLRLAPYVAAGMSYARSKFFGYYASGEDVHRNYSTIREDYVGTMRRLNATVGVGVEYKILETSDFVHVFGEFRCGHNLQSTTTRDVLAATSLNHHVTMNIGIVFGRRKD